MSEDAPPKLPMLRSKGIPEIARHRAGGFNPKEMRERQQMQMRRAKMGPLKNLEHDGDPLEDKEFSEDPIEELNDLVRHTGEAIQEEKKKVALADQHVRHQNTDVKAWSDAKFFTVLVFDTGKQCTAFIDALKVKCHLSMEGDLFLDGRHIADALGIELPPPEYQLKKHKTEVKKAMTKKLARKGDGKA